MTDNKNTEQKNSQQNINNTEINEPSFPVLLHLYDLTQGMAAQFSESLLGRRFEGIQHTGIVVYNQEYFFGGGIQRCFPGGSMAGKPTQIIPLGNTSIPQTIFHEFLHELSPRFTPETYSLLNHNCNNFTSEASLFLTGNDIPSFITSLPTEILSTPLGSMLRPMIENFERSMKGGLINGGESINGESSQSNFSSANSISGNGSSGSSDASSSVSITSDQNDVQSSFIMPTTPLQPSECIRSNLPITSLQPNEDFDRDEDDFCLQISIIISKSQNKEKIDASLSLSKEEIEDLNNIPILLSLSNGCDKSKICDGEAGSFVFSIIEKLQKIFARILNQWPDEHLLTVLSIFRILIMRLPKFGRYFSTVLEEGGLPIIYDLICRANLHKMAKENCEIKASYFESFQLFILSTLLTLFEHNPVELAADELLINAACNACRQLPLPNKNSQKTSPILFRILGSTLLYNCSLFLPNQNTDQVIRLLMELAVSSQVKDTVSETQNGTKEGKNVDRRNLSLINTEDSSKVARYRLMLALFNLLKNNNEAREFLRTLEFSILLSDKNSIEKDNTNKSSTLVQSPNIERLASQIEALLKED